LQLANIKDKLYPQKSIGGFTPNKGGITLDFPGLSPYLFDSKNLSRAIGLKKVITEFLPGKKSQ